MYHVEIYVRVRRACMVEGMSVREASRVFGLHRDTEGSTPDDRLLGPSGLPAAESAPAPQAGALHRRHRLDTGVGPERSQEAAPHGEADLPAAAGRVWVRRPVHHRPGKRRRITTGSHRTTGEAPVLETQTYRQVTPLCVKEPAPPPRDRAIPGLNSPLGAPSTRKHSKAASPGTSSDQRGTAQRTRTGLNIPPLSDTLQVFGLASILVLPAAPIGWGWANAPCAQGIWYLTAAWRIR